MPHRQGKRNSKAPAFTLIELMVTISIIALLVGILLPALNSVRKQAKNTSTQSTISSLGQGNEMFKANDSIGGEYVPSATDSELGGFGFSRITDPLGIGGAAAEIGPVAGAHLLVTGLAGADLLGSPGFKDYTPRDGWWFNDQGNNGADGPTLYKGAHYLYQMASATQQAGAPGRPRFGPFVGDNAVKLVSSADKGVTDGVIVDGTILNSGVEFQRYFVDAWERPILYYRARRGAIQMVTNPTGGTPIPGIYDPRDNAYLAGSDALGIDGINFGAGNGHRISRSAYPLATDNLQNAAFQADNSFERFVGDLTVYQRPTPVNKDTYLLISAGHDALYGTADDVVNWRKD